MVMPSHVGTQSLIKVNSSLKDQIIKSKKAWKKRKAMESNQGANAGASSSQTMHAPKPSSKKGTS